MVNTKSFAVVDQIFKDAGLHSTEISFCRVTLAIKPEKEVLTKLNKFLLPLGYSIIDVCASMLGIKSLLDI